MSDQPQNSFIPKRTTEKVTKRSGKKRIYVLGFVSYIFFFGVVLAVAGMYGYQEYLKSKLAEQQTLLANERDSFDASTLNQVKELDLKLKVGDYLLNRHVATSRLFGEIEPMVTQNTYLESFSYTRSSTDEIELSLSGRTSSLGEFIIQRDALKKSPIFASAEFSSINYTSVSAGDAEGVDVSRPGITFSTSIQLRPEQIKYVAEGTSQISNQPTTETVPESNDVNAEDVQGQTQANFVEEDAVVGNGAIE